MKSSRRWSLMVIFERSEEVSEDWKTAKVTPIFKKGDPKNYRPVSLTLIPGKRYFLSTSNLLQFSEHYYSSCIFTEEYREKDFLSDLHFFTMMKEMTLMVLNRTARIIFANISIFPSQPADAGQAMHDPLLINVTAANEKKHGHYDYGEPFKSIWLHCILHIQGSGKGHRSMRLNSFTLSCFFCPMKQARGNCLENPILSQMPDTFIRGFDNLFSATFLRALPFLFPQRMPPEFGELPISNEEGGIFILDVSFKGPHVILRKCLTMNMTHPSLRKRLQEFLLVVPATNAFNLTTTLRTANDPVPGTHLEGTTTQSEVDLQSTSKLPAKSMVAPSPTANVSKGILSRLQHHLAMVFSGVTVPNLKLPMAFLRSLQALCAWQQSIPVASERHQGSRESTSQ
ncbi:hypothetical protein llap_2132 [Limosa lapponica baueri]|uniref:Uncharacterized protein n=1 Tax=Limosa lapponica baueri TaxID=1758121 RepID=A0A2I0UNF2_LIMLA|nr:hypothetical protein llap_2132 [Limosa lapponica baueri]